ncbi:pyrroline-5-carboxylate reductase [Chloroflexota bacterium]
MRITFVGSGVMGEAILQGILDKGLVEAGDVRASDISAERRSYIKDRYGVDTSEDNRSAIEKADLIVLAVKPVSLPEVMIQLKGCLDPGQLVLSIVAGAKVDRVCQGLEHRKVIRAMPNMPAQIGEGITVWTATGEVKEEDRQRAGAILGALGVEVFCKDEHYIDMSTAVSGSGPAYVFTVIESLIDGAVQIGLPHKLAREMVLQTVSGATHMVQESGKHPAELRNMVTSPGGTTAQGLLQLEEGGLRALMARAIIAAYEKAKDLGRE